MKINAERFVGCLLVMLVSIATAVGQTAPTNDDFANRTVVVGNSATFGGTLVGATYESLATNHPFGQYQNQEGRSVWWTWAAPQTSAVIIQMVRDFSLVRSSNTVFGVYVGDDQTGFTEIGHNSFDAPAGRYVVFSATAGTSYQFRMWGFCNQPFSLKLTATNAPVFLRQPIDCVVSPHGSAFFSSMAGSLEKGDNFHHVPDYQWKFNGVPIPGATAPSLLIHDVSTNEGGSYSVIASNSAGIAESTSANLTVVDTNPVPRLAALPPINPAQMSFSMTGEIGRWYKIESSQALSNWQNPVWLQATNTTGFLSLARLGPSHFVRGSLNLPTDVCIGQLKQMQWAQQILAIENNLAWYSAVSFDLLKPYVPAGPGNSITVCPENGTYTTAASILQNPTCSLSGHGHQLPPQQ